MMDYNRGLLSIKVLLQVAICSRVVYSWNTLPINGVCNSALGMANGKIPSESILASRHTAYWERYNARLSDKVSGWCAGISSDQEWLQIDLRTEHYITAVANQGTYRGFMYEYIMAFSRGFGWFDVMENGTVKVFRRNPLLHHGQVVIHNMSFPVRAKMIRLHPTRSIGETCTRLELYGCPACLDPFGVADGTISNISMASSSFLGPGFESFHGRLNGITGKGSWCAKKLDLLQYLQIDLGDRYQVTMIGMQGNAHHEWVLEHRKTVNCSSLTGGNNINHTLNSSIEENGTVANNSVQNVSMASNSSWSNDTQANQSASQNSSVEGKTTNACYKTTYIYKRAFVTSFELSYSDNAIDWKKVHEGGNVKRFEGSTDVNTTKVITLNSVLFTRYLRIIPIAYSFRICMRVEIYGCKECLGDLGAGSGELSNDAMTASSYLGAGFQPWLARLLNPNGAWCSSTKEGSQFLQVHFRQIREIRQIRTQGSVAEKAWVQSYFIEHSQDGENWITHKTFGTTTVINANINEDGVSMKTLLVPFIAKFVRIRPLTWHQRICLRMELFGCPACDEPLGMESNQIWSGNIKASNHWVGYSAYNARLNGASGWSYYLNRQKPHFIQVQVADNDGLTVSGVATQSLGGLYVKLFTLSYSFDNFDWAEYDEDGAVKVFEGNDPAVTPIIKHELKREITSPRHVRLYVKGGSRKFGLRFELYGCRRHSIENANAALNRPTNQSGKSTLNSQFAVDGNYSSDISLGSCSLTTLSEVPWWRVQLYSSSKVTGVFIVNGDDSADHKETALSIRVGYVSGNGGVGNPPCGGLEHRFTRGAAKMVRCKPAVRGMFVTIFSLQRNSRLSLCEVEVEISKAVKDDGLGMHSGLIPDKQITASSWYSPRHLPHYGRMGTNIGHGGWCAKENDRNQFLEMDLGKDHVMKGMVLEGKHQLSLDQLGKAWVTEFYISFTTDREKWNYVTDVKTHQAIVFVGNDEWNLQRSFSLPGFTGRVLRIHPNKWKRWPCLRVELKGYTVCETNFGLHDGKMSLVASTGYSNHMGDKGRLYSSMGWSPRYDDPLATLKIDFGIQRKIISAVAVQSMKGQFVFTYELLYSPDGLSWRYWTENGHVKAITEATTPHSIYKFILPYRVAARYLILRPREYYGHMNSRVEVYGCTVEDHNNIAVGVKYDYEIANSSMTASSWMPGYYPYAARLDQSIGNGSWCAGINRTGEFLQVDIGQLRTISKLAVQCDSMNNFRVTSFILAYTENGFSWKNYSENSFEKKFSGASFHKTTVHTLHRPFRARKIRILVMSWYQHSCMRLELYYLACKDTLDSSLKGAQKGGFTASSFLGPSFEPWRAGLFDSNKFHSWCAENGTSQFLQIDLRIVHKVTGISTRGVSKGIARMDAWVEEYSVQYSEQGDVWINHRNKSSKKTFAANKDAKLAKFQDMAFFARFVRLYPTKWQHAICMKVELRGCKACFKVTLDTLNTKLGEICEKDCNKSRRVCSAPLGMEEGEISNSQIITSPVNSGLTSPRLNNANGFSSSYKWLAFIQVDFGPARKHVTAIAVQGVNRHHNTWSFYVQYMATGSEFSTYAENGVTRIFHGGEDMDLVAKHYFSRNITTRFFRVRPLTWSFDPSIRVEFYGCSACEEPLGIEKGLFKLTASSYKGPGNEPDRARFHHSGIWRPATNREWEFLQVNFEDDIDVTGIATEGNSAVCGRVATFSLYYSTDGLRFVKYIDWSTGNKIAANSKDDKAVFVKFLYVLRARQVRVRPVKYVANKCIRIELYGCPSSTMQSVKPLGLGSEILSNSSISASSSMNWLHKPEYGRLNTAIGGGAWCARDSNTTQYFQVDLREVHKVTNIVLQGKYSRLSEEQGWVTKFSITHSLDGVVWKQHQQNGLLVFDGNSANKPTRNHEVTPYLLTRSIRIHAEEWRQLVCMRVELLGCKACAEPLGLGIGYMSSNYYLSASHGTGNGIRLNNGHSWSSYPHMDSEEFVQITVSPFGKTVTAIVLQAHAHWVTSFTLATSEDGTEWHEYVINGIVKVFSGCKSHHETVRISLPRNITSRYLRLHPRTWQNRNYLRLELYGCDECADPLGMVSGLIPDSSIWASSSDVGGEPWRARLGPGAGWVPSTASADEYLVIDLGTPNVVSYIEIQGTPDQERWSSFFNLEYKMETNEPWKLYKPRGWNRFRGLEMRNMILKVPTEQKLEARFVKFRPKYWVGKTSLKLEFYGCRKVCSEELGFESWKIKDAAFTASSYKSSRSYPWMARLNALGAWCAHVNDTDPFLQVDLGKPFTLGFIVTQGLHRPPNKSAWVKKYTLKYRTESSPWTNFVENGNSSELLSGNTDGSSIVKHQLTNATGVRFIRFHATDWHSHACVRIGLYGCKELEDRKVTPLGMSDKRISDSSILASDSYESHGPWKARLNSNQGCWVFRAALNFLQVDLGERLVLVSGVATQGCFDEVNHEYGYVLEYQISFSDDGVEWYYYQEDKKTKNFSGNNYREQHAIVQHFFTRELLTRYVKFHTTRFVRTSVRSALRAEIYGKRIEAKYVVDANASLRASSSRFPSTARDGIMSDNKTWCAEFDDDLQFLEIDLKQSSYIMGIATRGSFEKQAWVENYTVLFGDSGSFWIQYKEGGVAKVFQGNNDSSSIVKQQFSNKILARFIRIYPVRWNKHICMGTSIMIVARSVPLGIQKQKISDTAMTAFSHAGSGSEPWRARLDLGYPSEGWRAGEDSDEQYLQIDLGNRHNITHVATQGRYEPREGCWVTRYKLSYSLDGSSWSLSMENSSVKVFLGNVNDYDIVRRQLSEEITARYIRFLPVTWFRHVCMKVELYGYKVCGFPLGVNSGELKNNSFTASSSIVTYEPWSGRLNRVAGGGAWCASSNKEGEYLEINLGKIVHVTGLSTQGKHGQDGKWVSEYHLYYRPSSDYSYVPYKLPNGTIKVFAGNSDQFSAVTHRVKIPDEVHFLKFVVKSWHVGICMRVEVLGCTANPVNGGYTDWSSWSACSASCAGGLRSRERNCTNPKPRNNGNNCTLLGADMEVEYCNTNLCPALSIAFPSVVARASRVLFNVVNCSGSEMRLDLGDCNVRNTSLCIIEHTYNATGIFEIVLQVLNHSTTRRSILVEDPVLGFAVLNITKVVIFRDAMFLNWKIDSGTAVVIAIDFGDNSATQKVRLARVSTTVWGNTSYVYKSPGVFPLVVSAMNDLSNTTVSHNVVVEIPLKVSCLLVQNLGHFYDVYQKDPLNITVHIEDGSNPEVLFIMRDDSNFTQKSTELSYIYQDFGTKNITVFVYNNVSVVQIRKTVPILEIISIGNLTLDIPPANVTVPVLMTLNITKGFPYQCVWDFGDGKFNSTSSRQNVSCVRHAYQENGVFSVSVNCSNNFGFSVVRELVTVQQPIENLAFTNNCPRPIDQSVTFSVFTTNKGTTSCYVFDGGDGTFLGFGHSDCNYENRSMQFTQLLKNYFSFGHNYSSLGRFDVSLKAWNLVSNFVVVDKVVVVKIPCSFPTITVPGFVRDFDTRLVTTPLQTLRFRVLVNIDCRATNERDIEWTATLISSSSKEALSNGIDLNPNNRKLEYVTIPAKTLMYGVYQITCNVSMVGQDEVYSIEEGFIEIRGNPLIPSIDGGSFVQRAFDKPCTFDGSDSRDPDNLHSNLSFYWFCRSASDDIPMDLYPLSEQGVVGKATAFNATSFCSSSGKGTLMSAGASISIHTASLQPYSSYAVTLFVAKTVNQQFRISNFSQVVTIVDGDPPVVKIRCKRNCGATINPVEGLLLEASIDIIESEAIGDVRYRWIVLEKAYHRESLEWKKFKTVNLTKISQLYLPGNTLLPGNSYKVSVTAMAYGRKDGYSENEYLVNIPPRKGTCTVDNAVGFSKETLFTFLCEGWIDEDLPLSYEFLYQTRYGVVFLLYHGLSPFFSTRLPIGDFERNFKLDFRAKVFDAQGTYSTVGIDIQVLLKLREQNKTLTEIQQFLNNTLPNLLLVGKTQEAASELNAFVSVFNAYSFYNRTNGMEKRQQIRTEIGTILTSKTPVSLFDVKQIGSTLSEVIVVKEEVPLDLQAKCLKSFKEMAGLVKRKSNEKATLAGVINDTAVIVETGLMNIIRASSDSARVFGEQAVKDDHLSVNSTKEKARGITVDAMAVLDSVTDVMSSLAVVGEEPIVISSPHLSLVLQKMSRDADGENVIGNGREVVVQLPDLSEVFDEKLVGEEVDVQVLTFLENPYTWDISSQNVSSHVLSVVLKDDKRNSINLSSLQNDIDLFITRDVKTLPKPTDNFVNGENEHMHYHKFSIRNAREPMSLQVIPDANKEALFEIHWRRGARPKSGEDNVVAVVPDFTSCRIQGNGLEQCEDDPYIVFIDASLIPLAGEYYLGIAKLPVSNASINGSNSRKRRSCVEGTRVKRSCIVYKDPPPKPSPTPQGEYKIQMPQYDANRDINYTFLSFSSPCLYWDEKSENWTSKGCKVGKKTRADRVHCLCNHLTSFGGGFIVAPNPIDFDKVFEGFKNFSDNVAVLATIVSIFCLYIMLVIWLRRLDKRDETIGLPTVINSSTGENAPSYEVIIQTGPWRGSGTTANVSLVMVGEEGESDPIALMDETKTLFSRGSTNEFLVSLPKSLGGLLYLKVWHDLSGINSSWYLDYVIIRDKDTEQQYIFACNRWFALEKGDGSVSRVLQASGPKELTSFGILFRSKTSKDIFDGHLWMSVIGKPSKSKFTRVQRVTCCMSLLYSAMITNAMFYNIGNTPDTSTVTLGPLSFSIKQIMIGIQSSLIALPLNVVIIEIFRNLKEKQPVSSKYQMICPLKKKSISPTDKLPEDVVQEYKAKADSNACLPHSFIYIAYTLSFVTTLAASTFTLFYSMAWGKEISNKWLSSILISFFQDAFVTQPLKIVLAAIIISLILKKLPSDFVAKKHSDTKVDIQERNTLTLNPDEASKDAYGIVEPPDEALVEKARKYKMDERKAFSILREGLLHLVFLLSLMVISYSTRDPEAYAQSDVMRAVFSRKANDIKSLWSFVDSGLLPFIFDTEWYNGMKDHQDGFTDDKSLYIVGMPRLRQLRAKSGFCENELSIDLNMTCEGSYSFLGEEKGFFLPGWVKMADLEFSACPIPWRYQTSAQLDGVPFWSRNAIYGGGGFTADLGYFMEQAQSVVQDLQTYKWVDKYSRAVFVELTLFNAAANLFSSVTYLVEFTGTGGASTFLSVDTFRLYPHVGPLTNVVAACEFVATMIFVVFSYMTCRKIFKTGREFLKNAWNVVDLTQVALCISAVILYAGRIANATWTVNKMEENPFIFISFQYALKADEINTYVMASIVFIATLKFLQILSFNRHIAILSRTISQATKGLLPLGIEALIVITAFNIFAYVVFGNKVHGMADIVTTTETTLAMTLGKAYFMDLSHADRLLGPLFFAVFVLAMQFFLLNMFMAVVMDSYSDVSSETNGDSSEFEMADFLLYYFKSVFGGSSEFKAGHEVWRNTKKKQEPVKIKRCIMKENCERLNERRENLSKKIRYLCKLDSYVGQSELELAEHWCSHCLCDDSEQERTQFVNKLLSVFLCHQLRASMDPSVTDQET